MQRALCSLIACSFLTFTAGALIAQTTGGGLPARPTFQHLNTKSISPGFSIWETDAPANEQRWLIDSNAGDFRITHRLDDGSPGPISGGAVMRFSRSDSVLDQIFFNAPSMTWNGQSMVNVSSAPTWTAQHVFSLTNNSLTNTYPIKLVSGSPGISMEENDTSTDNKRWDVYVSNGVLRFRTIVDDGATSGTWLAVNRSGTSVSSIALTGAALTLNGANVPTSAAATKIAYAVTETYAGSPPTCAVITGPYPISGIVDCVFAGAGTDRRVNFVAGTFTKLPVCSATSSAQQVYAGYYAASCTNTYCDFHMRDGTGPVVGKLAIQCMGY